MWLLKLIHLFKLFAVICGLLFTFSSCIQTRTLTTSGKKLNEFNRPDYMGTYAAVYQLSIDTILPIDKNVSLLSIHKNDSIIRKRVKSLSYNISSTDSTTNSKLSEGLAEIIHHIKTNRKIKGCPNLGIFKVASGGTKSNFNLYFVSTGFYKDSLLHKKDRRVAVAAVSTIALSSFLFGVVGAGVASYYLPKKNDYIFKGKSGLSGYVIVFDKSKSEICYVREQFFQLRKDPLRTKSINKQIKNAFKELYF
jgi:predicted membrane metal-binding protein